MCFQNLNWLLWLEREAIYLPLAFVCLPHFRFCFTVLFCSGTHFVKLPNVFVSTHLGEVLQGKRLCHVVKLRTTHGFSHCQHSQTVGGSQLLLWKPMKSADGETNVDRGRKRKRGKRQDYLRRMVRKLATVQERVCNLTKQVRRRRLEGRCDGRGGGGRKEKRRRRKRRIIMTTSRNWYSS